MKNVLLAGIALIACATTASSAPEEMAQQPRTDRYGDPLPAGAIARLGTRRLRGCQGPVVFSPDGKYVVAAGGEGNTRAIFWDLVTGRRVKALTAKGTIGRLAFSPDGKLLAAANAGYFSSVWDVATGKERFTFTGSTIAFSADGKKLLSTYGVFEKTTVRCHDTNDGKHMAEWSLAHPRPADFTLSADGQFAAAPRDGAKPSISVFDLQKKVEVKKLPVNVGRIQSSGFSRDGSRLVAQGANGWSAWEWESGKFLRTWNGRVLNVPVFSPAGRRLAWIGADEDGPGVVSLWVVDLDGGQPHSMGVTNLMGWPQSVAFSPDGKKLAVITEGNALAIVDSRTGRDLLPLDAHAGRVFGVAFTTDARLIVTRDSFCVLVWETATGRLLRRLPDDLPAGETVLLNTATHGRIVTVQSADNTLRLRDLATGKELRRLKGKDGYYASAPWDVSAVSSDGTSAAILSPTGIRVYDLDNGAIRCHFTTEHPIWGMDFSVDGRILVVTIQDFQKGLLTIFRDARTGRKVETAEAAIVRRSLGGRWQESSGDEKTRLRRLKLLDNEGKPAFAGEDGLIVSVYESPGGRYLAVQGRTGLPHVIDDSQKQYLRIWDTATRRLVMELDNKNGSNQIAGFSPDGRAVASATYSTGTIHLWEIATGRERLRLRGHRLGDVRLAFRPDGRVLLSGGPDTQVFLWDVTGRAADGVWRDTRHPPERLSELWETLAGDDAAGAYRAMWSLVAAPSQTLALMRGQLQPVAAADPRQLTRLLADLDGDSFAVRTKATQELERLGELAKPALRRTLAGHPTLESRRRCEDLLEKLSVLSAERRRAIRAVEVIEHIGTTESRALLERLRQGAPEARLTREAREAANRSLQAGGGQPR